MAGKSYDISNPIHNLRLAASSCFFGEPQYYHREKGERTGRNMPAWALDELELNYLAETLDSISPVGWRDKSPTQLMEFAIDRALDYDIEATLQEAVRLRNEENIRTTPQVILVRAANHANSKGTGLVRRYAPQIVTRGDESAVCMAYQLNKYGRKAIPNSLKRALSDKLSNLTEYQLAKYRMEGREVSTVDVVNLVHPKSTPALTKLVNGELKTTGETWEAIRSSGGSWEDCIKVMGHMALLRNLRNFEQNGVNPDLYLSKLVDGAVTGRQLPFRYYSAYKALGTAGNPRVLDAVEECLELSFANAPHFPGRTISLCDNSGSAWAACTSSMGTMMVAEIANITGVITGKATDEGYVGIFGDGLKIVPVRQHESVFTLTDRLSDIGRGIGGGTENGIWIFWRNAIEKCIHYDHVFVYSDMQAGHGGLYGVNPSEYSQYIWAPGKLYNRHIDVPKLISTYRSKVNPHVNVYLVQVAGYQDTIIPEFYNKTYILGGWGDGILRFAATMAGIVNDSQ
jgi:hypothetical protein